MKINVYCWVRLNGECFWSSGFAAVMCWEQEEGYSWFHVWIIHQSKIIGSMLKKLNSSGETFDTGLKIKTKHSKANLQKVVDPL